MRCPNGSRRNKKTMVCEKKGPSDRCPNGTRRNKAGLCVTPIRSRVTNIKDTPDRYYLDKPLQVTGDSVHFIDLCNKHILKGTLNHVIETSHLQYGDCNVFMIGEQHYPYTNTKCTAILEMFKSLIRENLRSKPVMIDVLIEFLEYTSHLQLVDKLEYTQMSRVRNYLKPCIEKKNCSVRVHWTDPSKIRGRIKQNPMWLQLIGSDNYYEHIFTEKWTEDSVITGELQTKDDMMKVLTQNVVVMKEVEKATQVYPQFKEYAFAMFKEQFELTIKRFNGNWKKCVLVQVRRVMDVYTAARIIKGNMKNIIVYAGQSHTNFMFRLLCLCRFSVINFVKGTCQ